MLHTLHISFSLLSMPHHPSEASTLVACSGSRFPSTRVHNSLLFYLSPLGEQPNDRQTDSFLEQRVSPKLIYIPLDLLLLLLLLLPPVLHRHRVECAQTRTF